MRHIPSGLEQWLYIKLLRSAKFHSFVRSIYCKVNRIQVNNPNAVSQSNFIFQPTATHKFNAFCLLFWDELKNSIGLKRTFNDHFRH
ncbi:Mrx7p Ecym_6452 [Eremothecium cymbalariae DBVPG|uniref:Uncharacterized protein n=1 Tax=Eremothecium cymbalariae (strain CBS 270.75 / DBVPG 7215 / KCTC 17166 / NRRL Y-17582) TaxID=931890 RepID=G8JUP3_ERECY|nr:hypothetical protein Ecym_6452 [Eremothecium cymbalariae DBVPG\